MFGSKVLDLRECIVHRSCVLCKMDRTGWEERSSDDKEKRAPFPRTCPSVRFWDHTNAFGSKTMLEPDASVCACIFFFIDGVCGTNPCNMYMLHTQTERDEHASASVDVVQTNNKRESRREKKCREWWWMDGEGGVGVGERCGQGWR